MASVTLSSTAYDRRVSKLGLITRKLVRKSSLPDPVLLAQHLRGQKQSWSSLRADSIYSITGSIQSTTSISSEATTAGISLPTSSTSVSAVSASKQTGFEVPPSTAPLAGSLNRSSEQNRMSNSLPPTPGSSSWARSPPPLEVVPWAIYEHIPDSVDARSLSSHTSGGSSEQKEVIRVVGRGGHGSRPRKQKSIDVTSELSMPMSPALSISDKSSIAAKSLPESKPGARMVGRGGSGAKVRVTPKVQNKSSVASGLSSISAPPPPPPPSEKPHTASISVLKSKLTQQRPSAPLPPPPPLPSIVTSTPPTPSLRSAPPTTSRKPILSPPPPPPPLSAVEPPVEKKVIRMAGRGGAGAKPRAMKPAKPKPDEPELKFKWRTGKSKSSSSHKGKLPHRAPSRQSFDTTSMLSDTSSIHFAPMPPLPLPKPPKPPSSLPPTSGRALDDIPPSPVDPDSPEYPPTLAEDTTSTNTPASSVFHASANERRTNKLARTLGETPDGLYMNIRQPGLLGVAGGDKPVDANVKVARRSSLVSPNFGSISSYLRQIPDPSIPSFDSDHDQEPGSATSAHVDRFSVYTADSNVEVWVDDEYDTSSIARTDGPSSPILFSSPTPTPQPNKAFNKNETQETEKEDERTEDSKEDRQRPAGPIASKLHGLRKNEALLRHANEQAQLGIKQPQLGGGRTWTTERPGSPFVDDVRFDSYGNAPFETAFMSHTRKAFGELPNDSVENTTTTVTVSSKRRESKQGWIGRWNRKDMQDVIQSLRELRA